MTFKSRTDVVMLHLKKRLENEQTVNIQRERKDREIKKNVKLLQRRIMYGI